MKILAPNGTASPGVTRWISQSLAALFNLTIFQHRYFIGSIVLYFIILLFLRNYVISQYPSVFKTLQPEGYIVVRAPSEVPPPPVRPQPEPPPPSDTSAKANNTMKTKTLSETIKDLAGKPIAMTAPAPISLPDIPVVAPPSAISGRKMDTEMDIAIARSEHKRIQTVLEWQRDWFPEGAPRGGRPDGRWTGGAGKNLVARFTIFQAKYQDGDWDCNPEALKDMMLQIRAWSRNRIDANLFPEVLDVGTEQLFAIKPPFVYLTGHKDFRLKEQEVKNLRDYLMLGGAIWADSALAGRRSRFDIAFRREMNRIFPDRNFEPVKPDHDLFDTFFEQIGMPSGINYYEEPVEMINIGQELAVLYTLNGYGHFWESRLNKDGKIEWGRIITGTNSFGRPRWAYVFGPHLGSPRTVTGTLYRNINDETVRNSYKFGINVVVHLLTRYQKYCRLTPLELPMARAGNTPERNLETR